MNPKAKAKDPSLKAKAKATDLIYNGKVEGSGPITYNLQLTSYNHFQ